MLNGHPINEVIGVADMIREVCSQFLKKSTLPVQT